MKTNRRLAVYNVKNEDLSDDDLLKKMCSIFECYCTKIAEMGMLSDQPLIFNVLCDVVDEIRKRK